ncbi:hypothetical protein ABW21_db0203443 [Orbilia brochopaga]|nr:hypothetical protein ABW21_db0203443 [Drechslerella brochopaga]
MDEALAHCALLARPRHAGATANLEVEYRGTCDADRFVIIKAGVTKVEGRTTWVSGRLESLPGTSAPGGEGKLLVEASALMIEPKVIGPMAQQAIPIRSLVS